MKRLPSFLLILGLILFPFISPVNGQNTTTRFFIAYDYENLTVDSTAGGVALDADKVSNPSNPVESAQLITFSVTCDGGGTSCNSRFTLDGTAPTTANGILVQYGAIISIYQHNNIVNFRAIREGATSAIYNVQYFR